MRVTMKITRNGETIFDEVKEFDTPWEANSWCTRNVANMFGDDLDKVRVRHTNETVRFDSKLDVVEQQQLSDYTTIEGVGYATMIDLFEES